MGMGGGGVGLELVLIRVGGGDAIGPIPPLCNLEAVKHLQRSPTKGFSFYHIFKIEMVLLAKIRAFGPCFNI